VKTKAIAEIVLLLLLLGTLGLARANPPIVTLMTDKDSYIPQQPINPYGTLTSGGSPVSDGLVALQVDNPINTTVVLRTLKTGPSPPEGAIRILDFYSCDWDGSNKTVFNRGTLAYFNITIYNSESYSLNVLAISNSYDSTNTTIGLSGGYNGPIVQNSILKIYPSLWIPITAAVGNATAYAGAFTNWPILYGTPYCAEKSTSFIIESKSTVPPPPSSPPPLGSYNVTFKLPFGSLSGTYHLYVSSRYEFEVDTDSKTVHVGIPGDANGDGKVNAVDFGILGYSWFQKPGDPHWDPRADFNGDNIVNAVDFGILGKYWFYGC